MLNYILRNIPEDTWKRAKHRAVEEGRTLRDILIEALEAYLQKKTEANGRHG